jgi:hypothetical protein
VWQDSPLTGDDLMRDCGDLRCVFGLCNQCPLKKASGQPINGTSPGCIEHQSA